MAKHIVVLGGGFAGVAAIKQLQKEELRDVKITLIDKNSYHLFTPSLYEVATSEEPRKNVAIPFSEIIDTSVCFIQATVKAIDIKNNFILLSSLQEADTASDAAILLKKVPQQDRKQISFDYLIVALGSQSAYMHIPGLEEHALPLKSLHDAIDIKNRIKNTCCEQGTCNTKTKLIIGGGGFSGTELAAEMLLYKNKLAKQNNLDKNCLDISIIQGSDRLVKELDPHVSILAQKRIADPQMHFLFGGHITQVTDTTIQTDTNQTYPYDILIWTGGVTANYIAKNSNFALTKHGQIVVNSYLQSQDNPRIFATGDIAGFVDQKGNAAPGVAQVAEDQGKIAAKNIINLLNKHPLAPYHISHWGYIVPLKGHFAAAELMGGLHIDGFFGWVLQQLVFFWYLLHILPFWKAFRRWNRFEIDLEQ